MRLLVLSSLLLSGTVLVLTTLSGAGSVSNVPAYTWGEIQAIFARRETVEAEARTGRQFHLHLEEVKRNLWQAGMTWPEAIQSVHDAALRDSPNFLVRIRDYHNGTDEQRIAHCLINHLAADLLNNAPLSSPSERTRLRRELRAWLIQQGASDLVDSLPAS